MTADQRRILGGRLHVVLPATGRVEPASRSPIVRWRALVWTLIGTLMLLVAPIPLPATGVPVGVVIVAAFVGLVLDNSQKRL